jgi:hypothetical protein
MPSAFICWACGTALTWGESDNLEQPDGTPHRTDDLQHKTAFYYVQRGMAPLSRER